MHASDTNDKIPRGFIIAAAALIVASMILALTARLTDIGAVRVDAPPVIQSVDLRFEERSGGQYAVLDARSNRLLKLIEPGRDGFVRVAVSGLEFDRKARGERSVDPLRLGRAADGGYWLIDPSTGRRLLLEAFGHANLAAFAQILDAGRNIE
jgi:putative photosynthetic complex assembly protein